MSRQEGRQATRHAYQSAPEHTRAIGAHQQRRGGAHSCADAGQQRVGSLISQPAGEGRAKDMGGSRRGAVLPAGSSAGFTASSAQQAQQEAR